MGTDSTVGSSTGSSLGVKYRSSSCAMLLAGSKATKSIPIIILPLIALIVLNMIDYDTKLQVISLQIYGKTLYHGRFFPNFYIFAT